MKPTIEMMESLEKMTDVRSFISNEGSYSLVMPDGKVSTYSGEELIHTAEAFTELLASCESGDKDRKKLALLRFAEIGRDLTANCKGDEMTPSEKLRLIALGFEYEKVTNAQAKSVVTALREAADALESLQKDAARFRWIRNNPQWIGYDSDFRPDEVEKQVDAAMSRNG